MIRLRKETSDHPGVPIGELTVRILNLEPVESGPVVSLSRKEYDADEFISDQETKGYEKALHVYHDESGKMGPSQGTVYTMGATIVSQWKLYSQVAPRTKEDTFIKSAHVKDEEEFKKSVASIDPFLEGTYILAIRKGSGKPTPACQHRIHAGGLLALASKILQTEKANQILATIDFTTQIENDVATSTYQNNPFVEDRDVKAIVRHARTHSGLASNDFIVGACARWFNYRYYGYVKCMHSALHYCVTDVDSMEKIGELTNYAQSHIDAISLASLLDWKYIDLSQGVLEADSDAPKYRDDANPRYVASTRSELKSDRQNSQLPPRDSKGRFVKMPKTMINAPKHKSKQRPRRP